MLVLSRRPDQAIVFPSLDLTVRILRIEGGAVRVGIVAPPRIKALRGELCQGGHEAAPVPTHPTTTKHELANRLNAISLALHLLDRQWREGLRDDADRTLARLLDELETLDRDQGPDPDEVGPHTRPIRALLVEDDDNERELLVGCLQLNGWETAAVDDGEEVLPYLATHGLPDLMLLDLGMPRCGGAETVRRVRAHSAYDRVKIVAVSSTRPEQVGLGYGPGGIDGWFSKPLRPRRFIDDLKAQLLN